MTVVSAPTIFLKKKAPIQPLPSSSDSQVEPDETALTWLHQHRGRVRSVKRTAIVQETIPSPALKPSVLTIMNHLSMSSLGHCVSVLTQSGRVHGVLEAIIENELLVRQSDGVLRRIFVYGIISVSRNSS